MAAQLTAESIREKVQEALRKRAPDSNLDSWLWQIFGATDISRDTLRALICDPDGSCPSMPTFVRLAAFFGPDFANEILEPLTGVHVGLAPAAADQRLEAASGLVDQLKDVLTGDNVAAFSKEKAS